MFLNLQFFQYEYIGSGLFISFNKKWKLLLMLFSARALSSHAERTFFGGVRFYCTKVLRILKQSDGLFSSVTLLFFVRAFFRFVYE